MEKQTGCVHIYCGDGKGKTTCGMGLCTRAAGYGYRVLIYQFMKDNSTSERKVLLLSPNVTFVPGQDKIKFSFLMTPEEKAEQKRYYEEQFQKVTEKAVQEEYDVLFLDELVYTIGSKLFDEQLLLDFLDHKPEKLEVILTGQGPCGKNDSTAASRMGTSGPRFSNPASRPSQNSSCPSWWNQPLPQGSIAVKRNVSPSTV